MSIRYYQDYWHYFDPDGKKYTQAEFTAYLEKNYPKPYPSDWITHSNAEIKLTSDLGWKKVMNPPTVPPLEEVVGKFLHVSQHAEPRTYIREKNNEHWQVWNYKDLDSEYWRLARPDIID